MDADCFSQFPYARLSSQDSLFSFKICSYGYAYPQAVDPYDRDWHKNHLLLTLPAFKAEIDDIILEGHLIKTIIKDWLSFSALLEKEVTFEPTEPYFGLTFRFMSQRKMIEVDGYVQYPVGTGAVLKFETETDLTYIDQFINGLENMLKTFPAIS
jgi:hypothetical protein